MAACIVATLLPIFVFRASDVRMYHEKDKVRVREIEPVSSKEMYRLSYEALRRMRQVRQSLVCCVNMARDDLLLR